MSTKINFDAESQVLNINTNLQEAKTYDILRVFNDLNPLLNEVMPDFDFSNKQIDAKNLAGCLKATMKAYGGIGLAANQCGIKARVFVIGNEDDVMVCFNPKIISRSEKNNLGNEGCLSFPGMYLKINRNESITVEYCDETGMMKTDTFSGLTARCFQHELDHLNGIKFTKHVGKTSYIVAKKKQEKLIKKFARGHAR